MPRLEPFRPQAGERPLAQQILLAASSGILLALTLPRVGFNFLGWVGLVPLILAWSSGSVRRAAAIGWTAGFVFHGVVLYWIYATCRFAGLHPVVGLLAWSALAGFLGLTWGLVGGLGRHLIADRAPLKPWAWAVLWTGVLAVTQWWTPRLGIDILAYTQYKNPALIQIGALTGPHGLGFIIVLFNAALAEVWLEVQRPAPDALPSLEGGTATFLEKAAAASVSAEAKESAASSPWVKVNMAAAFLLIGASLIYGKFEFFRRHLLSELPVATVRVEILQPNIDQYQKWDESSAGSIVDNFDELLSRPRQRDPDLVIWPESALPWIVREDGDFGIAGQWSRKLRAPQLVGVITRGEGGQSNAAFYIGKDGSLQGIYRKRELVPFGEYVPFPWLGRFIGILNSLGDTVAGEDEQEFFRTPLGLAAGSICYEALFPRWARRDASRGARVIFNITNDGWYKDTWGPYQHFYSNVYRAIENRVTVIRSGNTGISGVIDPWGVITARMPLNTRGRLDVDVPLGDPFPGGSFYARHGDWLGRMCLIFIVVMGVLSRGRRAA